MSLSELPVVRLTYVDRLLNEPAVVEQEEPCNGNRLPSASGEGLIGPQAFAARWRLQQRQPDQRDDFQAERHLERRRSIGGLDHLQDGLEQLAPFVVQRPGRVVVRLPFQDQHARGAPVRLQRVGEPVGRGDVRLFHRPGNQQEGRRVLSDVR